MQYRLTGQLRYLAEHLTDEETVMETVLHPDRYRVTLDLGAYNGDTALSLMGYAPHLETVIALEPDEKNFAKLCLNTAKTGKVAGVRVVSDEDDIMLIENGGVIIRMHASDINVYKRDTQGVIVMRVEEGNRVIAVERADREPDEEAPAAAEENA